MIFVSFDDSAHIFADDDDDDDEDEEGDEDDEGDDKGTDDDDEASIPPLAEGTVPNNLTVVAADVDVEALTETNFKDIADDDMKKNR